MRYFFTLLIACLFSVSLEAQEIVDSAQLVVADSGLVVEPKEEKVFEWQRWIDSNKLVRFDKTPVAYAEVERADVSSSFNFYYLIFLLAFLGVLRYVYPKYVSNLFRVFFNTSLRQSQIADQLLMAKLPSLCFNILFVLSIAFYIYLALYEWGISTTNDSWTLLALIIAGLTLMYLIKYISIRFAGWVSNARKEADSYIFIVFLVNKILGILLIAVSPLLAFSSEPINGVVYTISYIMVVVLFLMRYIRSYDTLNSRLKINRFHFLLYIIGMEILPLLLVCKATINYLRDIS